MKIIRVFPYKTSYTPTDRYSFIGPPPFRELIPDHDEVHISCTFTWDKKRCQELAYQWEVATEIFQTKKPSTAKNGMRFVASGNARRRLGPIWKGERISRSLTHENTYSL